MNKRIAKLLSLTIALVLCMVMTVPAMAITMSGAGGAATVDVPVHLILDSNITNYPTTTITLTVTSTTPAEKTTGNFPVTAGIMEGVKIGEATVAEGQVAGTVTFQTGTTPTASGTDQAVTEEGKFFLTQNLTVDFSGVTFTEPGVYRYTITESGTMPTGVTLDTTNPRYIDVYVEYEATTTADGTTYADELTVQGFVVHSGNGQVAASTTTGGTQADGSYTGEGKGGFENHYADHDLTVGKTVTGNQGSRNKFFTVTVVISGLQEGVALNVVTTDASNTGSETNPTTMTADADGVATATFYLKHGQKVVIQNLPEGAHYTVTEVYEDYVPSVTATGAEVTSVKQEESLSYAVNGPADGITADTSITFINLKNGTIPTGVLLTIAPFVVLMVVGLAGAVLILKKKRN